MLYAGACHFCKALTKVIFPASIDILPGYAFKDCPNLKEIIYKGDVVTAKNDIFARSDLFARSVIEKISCKDGSLEIKDSKIVNMIKY